MCARARVSVTRQVDALEKRSGSISGPVVVYISHDVIALLVIREIFAAKRTRISLIRSTARSVSTAKTFARFANSRLRRIFAMFSQSLSFLCEMSVCERCLFVI